MGRFGAAVPQTVPVLDQMSVYDAVATMERVGAAAEGFHHVWQNAGTLGVRPEILQARGFETLRDDKLGEVLDGLWEDYKKQGGSRHDGFTSSYGWFYYWFNCKGGRNFSPLLAETFLAHGAELFSINTNARLGDLPHHQRRKLSLKEAAERCETSVFAMRQIGLALGLTRGEKRPGAQHSFSVEDVERIARDLKRACTLQEMSRELGIGHKGAHQLIDTKILVPAIWGGKAHKHVYVFRKDDVAALLSRLAAGATPVETATPGLLDLSRVRGSYAASTADILHAVLTGRVRVREWDASKRGLLGLYVDPRELASALADASGVPEISISLAARMTRLNIRGVVKAARRGLLTPVKRGNKTMILKESVETFCLDYMMLAELCSELGETMKAVRAFMHENGIAPEPKLTACRHVGYPRVKAEKLLAKHRAAGCIGIRKESSKQVLVGAVRAVLEKAKHPVPSGDMIRQLRQTKVRLGPSDDKQFFYASLWETRDEFVHIPSLGWWLKARPYAPGCYSPESEPADPHTRIADVMVEMLAEAKSPMSKDAVFAELHKRGIRVTSTDPIAFLRKVVARNRDRIAKLTGLGYWLRSRHYPPAKYDPASCTSGTQTTWERIGSFVVDHLGRTKKPADHDQLLKMLAMAGIVIRSRNRRDYLNDALSRNPDRIVYLRQHGYWLRHTPFGPAGYRPRHANRAA